MSNCCIHDAIFGVTDAGAAPGPKEAQEGEEETKEVPSGLEEWLGNGPMLILPLESDGILLSAQL